MPNNRNKDARLKKGATRHGGGIAKGTRGAALGDVVRPYDKVLSLEDRRRKPCETPGCDRVHLRGSRFCATHEGITRRWVE